MIDRWLMSSQRLIGRGKKEEGLDLCPPPTLAWKAEHDDGSAMVKLVSWIDSAPLPVVLNFAIQEIMRAIIYDGLGFLWTPAGNNASLSI